MHSARHFWLLSLKTKGLPTFPTLFPLTALFILHLDIPNFSLAFHKDSPNLIASTPFSSCSLENLDNYNWDLLCLRTISGPGTHTKMHVITIFTFL